ncbi:YfjI family protein [Flavobacteriaceae bacterium F08102]|nr:YfjI family protein [Flavobacteriaceae bacterium F08102]
MAAISACFPKLYGIYDGKKVFSNLFLFITAQASAGKGRLVHCRQLVNPIHKELREEAKLHKQHFELEMAEYNANKGKVDGIEKPAKPPEKMLFIPANNSSTGTYQLLGDSDGKGLIFETEGDTLAHAFKSDYGNYSDGFRKAFHHETISYYRRTDREFVDIESPCLSTVLSGTPKQVSALIPSAENGLFSRFIFYFMNVKPVWKNVFASTTDNGLDDYFENLGNQFYELYKLLKSNGDFQFYLTADQQEQFNQFFSEIQVKYLNLQGLDYMATIRRLGLIAFRFCMLFSALRILETGDTSNKLICEERDFQTALAMIKVLVKHSSKVFGELPQEETKPTRMNRKEKFLYALPRNFNRQKYLEVAKKLNIPAKTAEGYITGFIKSNLIHREQQDTYTNLSIEENEDVEEIKD